VVFLKNPDFSTKNDPDLGPGESWDQENPENRGTLETGEMFFGKRRKKCFEESFITPSTTRAA
jgi:hypothetical protein